MRNAEAQGEEEMLSLSQIMEHQLNLRALIYDETNINSAVGTMNNSVNL